MEWNGKEILWNGVGHGFYGMEWDKPVVAWRGAGFLWNGLGRTFVAWIHNGVV